MSQQLRQALADAYQIIAAWGMDDSTYAHISARVDADHFLIMPFGLLFEEVDPDCLLLVNRDGRVIEGKEQYYNPTGYTIHGSIYQARTDIKAIYHLHTPASIAVASSPKGLQPLSQWALHFYEKVAYGEYDSLVLDGQSQGSTLACELGDKKVILLKNHGFITCGKTLHEGLFYVHHLELACQTQAFSQEPKGGWDLPSHEVCVRTCNDLLNFEKDLGRRDWDAYVRKLRKQSPGASQPY
jgi:ribulose-5-phosphate 4-epimerase/fuculose-1-phosphate aldolase